MPETLTAHFDKYALQLARKGDPYEYYREISQYFHVDPGVYVVIPSTFDSKAQADYLLSQRSQSSMMTLKALNDVGWAHRAESDDGHRPSGANHLHPINH